MRRMIVFRIPHFLLVCVRGVQVRHGQGDHDELHRDEHECVQAGAEFDISGADHDNLEYRKYFDVRQVACASPRGVDGIRIFARFDPFA